MSASLLDELHWLTEALRAHVDWSRSTGSLGLPSCDASWLEQRRDHYRRTALQDANPALALTHSDVVSISTEPTYTPAQPIAHASAPVQAVLTALTLDPSLAPTPRAPKHLPVAVPPAAANDRSLVPAANKPVALDNEQKQARLLAMQQEVQACTKCGLCTTRKRPAFARGTGSSRIVFVGEGPGAEEDAQGIPFVGAAGQLLDRMIGAMGLSRNDVYVCNIIKCRPPNNRKPSEDEIAACRHFVVEQLELMEPQVIVALGATAVEGLLGLKLGITRLRGTWRLYEGRVPVMPTFHPAYLLRKPEAKREVWDDLQAVLARVNRTVPSRG